MGKGKSTPWIVASFVAVGAAIAIYVMNKKASKSTGSSLSLNNTLPQTNTPSTPASNTTPGLSNSIGKSAYVGKSGLIVRSSPELSDGFLGFGSNNVGAVSAVGKLLGIVQGTETDNDMDKNPMTGQPYVWYRIQKDPSLKLLSADNYYVREDYTTLK